MNVKTIMSAVLCLAAAQVFASGKVISVLPDPVEGVYVLGSSTSDANPTATGATNYDYVVWSALNVPADSTVRLKGSIVLDSLPDNLTYDWSACTRLALVGADLRAKGKTLVVPANIVQFLAYDGTVNVSGDSFSITKASSPSDYHCATELNGTMEAWSGYGPQFYGPLSGAATGKISVHNFGTAITCYGPIDFAGWFYLGDSQREQGIYIYTSNTTATVGNVRTSQYASAGEFGIFCCQRLHYAPRRDPDAAPCTLNIGYLYAEGEANGMASGADQYRRFGSQFCVYSNNTINIKKLAANKVPVGFFAGKQPFYKNKDMPKSFDLGVGNVKLANGSNMTGQFYVSPNINVTFTGKHGDYAVNEDNFYFTVETNIVNAATTLSFAGLTDYPNDGKMLVHANEPMNLPTRVLGKSGQATRTWLKFYQTTWNMPFDFGSANVNPARCETDVKVLAPGTGTVRVKNVTTDPEATYPSRWTEYPIVTFGATTNDFTKWTVVAENWPERVQVQKVVKPNGLYVRIRDPQGLVLTVR